jgi:hypothetical protein
MLRRSLRAREIADGSIAVGTNFEDVSNSPTGPGGCANFGPTLAQPPVGVRLCGAEVLYRTAIPATKSGRLFGSIELSPVSGTFVGITSVSETSAGTAPEIDLDALGCESPA